jgi:ATP-dependent DNA helicase RecG
VEFKQSADKSLAAEVCAFANASGGRVFIGVDDNGVVVGTDVSNIARSRIQDTINQIEPRLTANIAAHGNIIVITVPEGRNKPYSCSKGFYLRSGPNSQKLERDSIVEFLQSEGRVRYDAIVNEKLSVKKNINRVSFEDYLNKAGISNVLSFESTLTNLGCAELSAEGELVFTNAGALFFRNNRQGILFDHSKIICALYKGLQKADILDIKELDGGIVENIDNAIVFLKRHLNLRYEIEEIQRKNVLELPERALREAVVNAACHRDYFEIGARVAVEIYDDRVEITNPGGVPKGITNANFGTISVARNPIIASLLHRIHYIERMGTGITRIKQAMEKAGLDAPVFAIDGYFRVTFKRASIKEGKNGTVNGTNGTVNGTEKDSARILQIKEILENEPKATLDVISSQTGIARRTVARVVKKMKQEGLIRRVGAAKSGYWKAMSKEVLDDGS